MQGVADRFNGEVAVIGVHSAKFMAEKATENLREAVVRYGIEHPVVNDRDFQVWNSYAVRAWPTFIFIDPSGRVFAKHEGEISEESLGRFCEQALADYRAEGLLDLTRPLPLVTEEAQGDVLAFPGKVAVSDGRLGIADTNHDRILLATTDGRVQAAYQGFTKPQGLCFVEDLLYVADTGAHSVRAIDLRSGTVRLLAGTGRLAMSGEDIAAGSLRAPWDVAWLDGDLYVAMAGTHQIWRLRDGELRPYAGSGREGIQDGSIVDAWLAQPSGLATASGRLYVADSEVSGIREVDVAAGVVRTLIGTGLFDFGDRDGAASAALLQHPLSVAAANDAVYIADSYNNKIKCLDIRSQTVATIAGTGATGLSDGTATHASLNEPGGLAIDGERLYIADTNNHQIRLLALDTHEVSTLTLSGA